MTREEAIKKFKDLIFGGIEYDDCCTRDVYSSEKEAFEMAIQALEQNESAEKWYKLFVEKLDELEPCDDVVSRDMALEKMADYVASGYADSAEDFEEYSRIICQLPPVTQKSETVTEFADRCRECGARYGKLLEQKSGKWIDGVHAMGYREGYKDAQKQKSGKWIPVSERLPEDAQEVLYSTKTGRVFHGEYYDDNTDRKWFSYKDDIFSFNNVVTAWMPLPKPYETQESEE